MLPASFQPGRVNVVPPVHWTHNRIVVFAVVGVVAAVVVVVEGEDVLHLCCLGEFIQTFEARVYRGQVFGFVEHAVVRVIGITRDHFVHAAVVGVAQHHAALPGVQTFVAFDGF
ncbi:hypothetical protein D3C80_1232580 [compost metagenome]